MSVSAVLSYTREDTEYFMDSTYKKEIVVLEISRKLVHITKTTMDMPDSEMIVN